MKKSIKETDRITSNDCYVARIERIVSKADLMEALARSLCFPEYFGKNWDALEECLNDLRWIPQRVVFLIHDQIPNIGQEDFDTYLKILQAAAESWETEGSRKFSFEFPRQE